MTVGVGVRAMVGMNAHAIMETDAAKITNQADFMLPSIWIITVIHLGIADKFSKSGRDIRTLREIIPSLGSAHAELHT